MNMVTASTLDDSSVREPADAGLPDASMPSPAEPPVARRGSIGLTVLATLAVLFALQWGQEFLIPVTLAVFVAYTLNPLVSWIERARVPRWAGAALVLCTLISGIGFAIHSLRAEATVILEQLPEAAREFSKAIRILRNDDSGAVSKVAAAAREMELATSEATGLGTSTQPSAARVVMNPLAFDLSSLFWASSLGAIGVIVQLAMVIFLVFFLLQAGDTFKRKLVRVVGSSLSEKKITVKILDDIHASVQRYMFMLLVTNTLLALLSWLAYRVLDLDNAAAWAVAAGVIHIIPYFGPILIAIAVSLAAFMQFDSFYMAFLVGGVSVALATIIGTFVTTWMTGRLAQMNLTAVFVALLFFGWLWGPWGLLLASPIIVVLKVISEHIEQLRPFAELLGS